MGKRKLITPEFRITVGEYELKSGIEVECFSSRESHLDWCKVELSKQLQGMLKLQDMDEARVELGYDDDFDCLIDGYIRCNDNDYWKEIMIKDDMMKLERVLIKATFIDSHPQDIVKYILAQAGITNYELTDEIYNKKKVYSIDEKNGITAIAELNSSWGISNAFYFQNKCFYYGSKMSQDGYYVLEEDETIITLNKYGEMWEAETFAIPWIHHSQEVIIEHSKYNGIATIEKTIVRSDDAGEVHMYMYWR